LLTRVIKPRDFEVTTKLLLHTVIYLLKSVALFLTQKMFCAEDIVSDDSQQQNHVYNLLVALRNLSDDKRRRQDRKASTELAPQPVSDKGKFIGLNHGTQPRSPVLPDLPRLRYDL